MIAKLFEVLTEVVTSTLSLVKSVFTNTTEIFYIEETGFTFVGTLMLVTLGMSLAFFAWKVIKGLLIRG
jgi:hypothetical protein